MKPKVLIVEDEEIIRKFLSDVFSKQYDINAACNGQQGLEIYCISVENHNQPDIVITDMNMPMMQGNDLVKRIRAYETDLDIPKTAVIVMSGVPQENAPLLSDLEQVAAYSFMSKPFDLATVHRHVQEALRRREAYLSGAVENVGKYQVTQP